MTMHDRTSRHFKWLLLTAVLIVAPGIAVSDDLAVPKVITAGLDAYKKGGALSALPIWLTGSPLAGDKAAQSQAAQLSAIETYYGKLLSAELIKLYRISPSSKLTFMEAQFEKGALFMKFLTFNTGKNEVITTFQFHTDPAQILPSDLLYPDD